MVVGDPEGMRALATKLTAGAASLRAASTRYPALWQQAEVTGPNAALAGTVIAQKAAGFSGAASRFDALADLLRRSATQVEADREKERHQLIAAQVRERERLANAAKGTA